MGLGPVVTKPSWSAIRRFSNQANSANGAVVSKRIDRPHMALRIGSGPVLEYQRYMTDIVTEWTKHTTYIGHGVDTVLDASSDQYRDAIMLVLTAAGFEIAQLVEELVPLTGSELM